MEERSSMILGMMLNEARHLQYFRERPSAFKPQKKPQKTMSQKSLLKGNFFNYTGGSIQEFRQYYFELYPNLLLRYADKSKSPPIDYLQCQFYRISEQNDAIGDQAAFGLLLEGEDGVTKLVADKVQVYKQWLKYLKKYCTLTNFLVRYKVEHRIYEHFYRCVDKKKKMYAAVKIVNKKGLRHEQKRFVENEITIIRKLVNCPLLPPLKKIYEDDSYMYLSFTYFKGEDLLTIVQNSRLEEIAVATLAYHILKGLKVLHMNNYFHGNLKLENIIFSTTRRDNEIFLINFKYYEEHTPSYREKLIKKGNNYYVAPELLEEKDFDHQIDIFALGVCLFFMVFKKYPYKLIEKEQFQQQSNLYRYQLDLSVLEEMKNEKKKNPTSKQQLSASGIDFFLNLLAVDAKNRPSAAQAMNHSWFINFTSKSGKTKNGQANGGSNGGGGGGGNSQRGHGGQDFDMYSLRTIIESSEISERELETPSRLLIHPKDYNVITTKVSEVDENEFSECSSSDGEIFGEDEGEGPVKLMASLHQNSYKMVPTRGYNGVSVYEDTQYGSGDESSRYTLLASNSTVKGFSSALPSSPPAIYSQGSAKSQLQDLENHRRSAPEQLEEKKRDE